MIHGRWRSPVRTPSRGSARHDHPQATRSPSPEQRATSASWRRSLGVSTASSASVTHAWGGGAGGSTTPATAAALGGSTAAGRDYDKHHEARCTPRPRQGMQTKPQRRPNTSPGLSHAPRRHRQRHDQARVDPEDRAPNNDQATRHTRRPKSAAATTGARTRIGRRGIAKRKSSSRSYAILVRAVCCALFACHVVFVAVALHDVFPWQPCAYIHLHPRVRARVCVLLLSWQPPEYGNPVLQLAELSKQPSQRTARGRSAKTARDLRVLFASRRRTTSAAAAPHTHTQSRQAATSGSKQQGMSVRIPAGPGPETRSRPATTPSTAQLSRSPHSHSASSLLSPEASPVLQLRKAVRNPRWNKEVLPPSDRVSPRTQLDLSLLQRRLKGLDPEAEEAARLKAAGINRASPVSTPTHSFRLAHKRAGKMDAAGLRLGDRLVKPLVARWVAGVCSSLALCCCCCCVVVVAAAAAAAAAAHLFMS